MTKLSEYLTVGDAAELLGVSKDTLRRWDRAGKYSLSLVIIRTAPHLSCSLWIILAFLSTTFYAFRLKT